MAVLSVSLKTCLAFVLCGAIGFALALGVWTLIQDHAHTTIIWNLVNQPRPAAQAPPR